MARSGLLAPFVGIVLAFSAHAQPASSGVAEGSLAKCGGVELLLPPPEGGFTEVGDRLRTGLFELMTPSTNRLLTAYVPPQVQQDLLSGKPGAGLDLYAMVQVSRQAEYADVTPQMFEEVADSSAKSMGSISETVKNVVTDEMNARLRQLGGKSIAVDRPEMLGVLFRKAGVLGVAMLMGVKEADGSGNVTMAGTFALVHVKQRLVFAYIYERYHSPDTVKTLSKALEVWTDRIISANK